MRQVGGRSENADDVGGTKRRLVVGELVYSVCLALWAGEPLLYPDERRGWRVVFGLSGGSGMTFQMTLRLSDSPCVALRLALRRKSVSVPGIWLAGRDSVCAPVGLNGRPLARGINSDGALLVSKFCLHQMYP